MPGTRPYLFLLVLFAVAMPRVAHASGSWAVPRFTPTWAELEADLKALGVKKPPPKRPTLVARAHVPEKPSGPATDAVATAAKPGSDKPTVDTAAVHSGAQAGTETKPTTPAGPGIDAYLKPGQSAAACQCPPVPVCQPPNVLVPPGGETPATKPASVTAPSDNGAAKPATKKKTGKKKKAAPTESGPKKLEHKKYWWE